MPGPGTALQQVISPAPAAHSARIKLPADIPLMPAFPMFTETRDSEDQTMATQTLKLNVKTGEKEGKTFSNDRSQAQWACRNYRPQD